MASIYAAAGTLSAQQLEGFSKNDIQTAVGILERQRSIIKKQQERQESDELDKRLSNVEDRIKTLKTRINSTSDGECQTCANRKYQDGSDDPGVSFKSASKISGNAEAAVRGHEQEHVTRSRAKAEREGSEIVYQSVIIKRAICPECGDSYVSGGETTTVTRKTVSGDGSSVEKLGEDNGINNEFSDKLGRFGKPDDPDNSNHDSRFDVGLYDREVEHGKFLNIVA